MSRCCLLESGHLVGGMRDLLMVSYLSQVIFFSLRKSMRTGNGRVDPGRSTPTRLCCHGGGQSIWSLEPRGGGRRWDGGIRGYPGGSRVNKRLVEMEVSKSLSGDLPQSMVVQTWSPMAEISTLFPQLEHLMVGKKPMSMVAIPSQSRSREQRGVHRGFAEG